MNSTLSGKIALITGAAQGIGSVCAERLAAEGATVVVADLNEDAGQAAADAIAAKGGTATFVALDVTKEEAWSTVIEQIRSDLGGLHVLVNNAGIGRPSPLTEMSLDTFKLHFAINVEGMFLGMKHAIPLMTASGGGSIVNLSSAASRKAFTDMSAYCASKAALAHLSKVAALECARDKTGIRVNSLHPGIIATPAWGHLEALTGDAGDTQSGVEAMAQSTTALGFAGAPDDIADAVIYLAGPSSRYVTGTELVVDGGQLLM